jgi:hypothetical protein
MKMRTGLLLLAGVVVLACVMSSVSARVMDGAAVAADSVATATPMKPISTVISWKTGKKYGDKYAHKHGEYLPMIMNGCGQFLMAPPVFATRVHRAGLQPPICRCRQTLVLQSTR